MAAKNNGKISHALLAINMIPLLFFGIIILLLGTHWFTHSMYSQVEIELSNVSNTLSAALDSLYPGDYELKGEEVYLLYKGSHNLTNDYTLIDYIKETTGLEITLFYQDTRVLTTLTGNDGARIVGSGAPTAVIEDVLKSGEPHFYTKTIIYNSSYFSYYAPLCNQDGSTVGMLFVGKPTAEVDAAVQKSIYPLMLADAILVILTSIFTFLYTKKIVSSLQQLRGFLREVSTGNLNADLSREVLRRNDELGEIAHSALNMQHSLHTLVEQDALTSLANRRSGGQRLQQVIEDSSSQGKSFCIAIGDIDFFKKVNDTYGHDCGDVVLKNAASLLRHHMRGNGFAARWGGEEFLLVFEDTEIERASLLLEKLLDDIRAMETAYDDLIVRITMTFGLVPGNSTDYTLLLRNADEKLYEGKNTGRNKIVM